MVHDLLRFVIDTWLCALIVAITMQTLKEYIAAYPLKAKQSQWAKVFGISQPYLSQILAGRRLPHPKLMQTIEAQTRGRVPVSVWFQKQETSPTYAEAAPTVKAFDDGTSGRGVVLSVPATLSCQGDGA